MRLKELGFKQRKLSNVLLLNAYDTLITNSRHQIDARTLCLMIGYNSNDMETLKQSLKGLAETVAEWDMLDEKGQQEWGVSSLLSYAKLKGGVCEYAYSPALAEKLHDPKVFALINLNIQRRFTSGHALALYENCYRFVRTGSTGWWPLDLFRRLMGVDGSAYYETFKHLNAKVIKPAVAEVNKLPGARVLEVGVVEDPRRGGRRVGLGEVQALATDVAEVGCGVRVGVEPGEARVPSRHGDGEGHIEPDREVPALAPALRAPQLAVHEQSVHDHHGVVGCHLPGDRQHVVVARFGADIGHGQASRGQFVDVGLALLAQVARQAVGRNAAHRRHMGADGFEDAQGADAVGDVDLDVFADVHHCALPPRAALYRSASKNSMSQVPSPMVRTGSIGSMVRSSFISSGTVRPSSELSCVHVGGSRNECP